MSWVKFDRSRRNELPYLLSEVRLNVMSLDFIVDRVAAEELIKTSYQCRDLLEDAKRSHLRSKRKRASNIFIKKPRVYRGDSSIIYAFGSCMKKRCQLAFVEKYDVKASKWMKAEIMAITTMFSEVAAVGSRLYVIGGYDMCTLLKTVNAFDVETRQWTTAASLITERRHFGTAVVGGKIYACGGTVNDWIAISTVECFDPQLNTWTTVKSMGIASTTPTAVELDCHLYVIGGIDRRFVLDSVQRYDPLRDNWTELASMSTSRWQHGAASLNGKIYVCGGCFANEFSNILNTAEVYDPSSGLWAPIAPMKVARRDLSLVASCGKLYAIGGLNGKKKFNSVEEYDPQTNLWKYMTSVSIIKGAIRATVLSS